MDRFLTKTMQNLNRKRPIYSNFKKKNTDTKELRNHALYLLFKRETGALYFRSP